MKTVRIGSRESKLAVTQTQLVIDSIKKYHKDIKIELVTMKTTGDIILNKTLDKIGGKGLFVKELDAALMEGKIDLAVHSLKDMPMLTPEELPIVAFSKREEPGDALVLPKGRKELDPECPIGCSSQRRILQLKKIFPNATFKSVRGNVITRLEKLDKGEFGALVLACAGLKRLGLEHRISRVFTPEEIIPAAGQGILAVQGRRGEDYSFLQQVHDETAGYEAVCERAFVRELDGGCSSPVAAFAVVNKDRIEVKGLYYDEAGKNYITGSAAGTIVDAAELGEKLAKKLRADWS